ncbi:hypothetical protein MHYP_G00216130 [Metynnis hypsauchen]
MRNLTFEETVFAVYDIDPSLLQAGGAIHLTVVLVEMPIRTADRYKRTVAFLLAHTLRLACQLPDHTLSAPSTRLRGLRGAAACWDHRLDLWAEERPRHTGFSSSTGHQESKRLTSPDRLQSLQVQALSCSKSKESRN